MFRLFKLSENKDLNGLYKFDFINKIPSISSISSIPSKITEKIVSMKPNVVNPMKILEAIQKIKKLKDNYKRKK